MDKAIETLQQRFTVPSADLVQQNPLCGICWNDYEEKDLPVKLPCGHVFGEECVMTWARGTTPTGRHNGCPSCRAELLPPSLYSHTSALRYWSAAILAQVQADVRDYCGGPREAALFICLGTLSYTAKQFPEWQIAICIGHWTIGPFFLLVARILARIFRLSDLSQTMLDFVWVIVLLIVYLGRRL